MKNKQKGFTLVEIAIVLMIIGLLIGGVLRGQELITSARVRNIIDQKAAIQTAQIAFMDRYKMIPGDLTPDQALLVGNGVTSSGATGGDGVFLIVTAAALSDSPVTFQNLTATGFMSCGVCTATAPAVATINNSPTNAFGGVVRFGYANGSAGVAAVPANTYVDATAVQKLILAQGANIPSNILVEVDRKSDDTYPLTGGYRYSNFDGNAGFTGAGACTGSVVLATATQAVWANPSVTNCEAAWML